MDIGIGLSLERNSVSAAKEAVRQARVGTKEHIDLCIAFSSTDLASTALLQVISDSLGDVPVVGASGSSIISNQGIFSHGLVVLLVGVPEDIHFTTACISGMKGNGHAAGEELGEKLLVGFQGASRNLGILLSDSLVENPLIIQGIQERLGKSFPLYGASCADSKALKSRIFFNRELVDDSCGAILWGGKLNFGAGIKHGWKPIGKPHTITKVTGNLIETIDAEEAALLYQEYIGCDRAGLKKDLEQISIFYPLGVQIPGEDEYILRNAISVLNNGSLYLNGDISEGSKVRLMISTKETCLTAVGEAADDAERSLFSNPLIGAEFKKENINKFALVFNSASRTALLKRDAGKELDILKEKFGAQTPIIGIYTQLELAPLKAMSYRGGVYCHNQTSTVLLIGS